MNMRIRFLTQRSSIAAFWDLGMNKYLIVIEATETGYSAYSRDLPGCISTSASRDGRGEEGQPVPEPHTYSAYVELPVQNKNVPVSGDVSIFQFHFSKFQSLLQIIPRRPFQKSPQLPRARRMPQLAQRFCFNLPYAFARDRERLPDFLERVLAAVVQTKPHLNDFFLARRQRLQHRRSLFLQIEVNHRIGRRNYSFVFDEVAQVRIFFLANRRLKGDRLLRNLQNLAHLGYGYIHTLGNLFASRFPSQFLHQLPARPHQLVDRLDHVYGNADGACLVCNRACDCLTNPPSRIRGKLVSTAPFELVYRFHQP